MVRRRRIYYHHPYRQRPTNLRTILASEAPASMTSVPQGARGIRPEPLEQLIPRKKTCDREPPRKPRTAQHEHTTRTWEPEPRRPLSMSLMVHLLPPRLPLMVTYRIARAGPQYLSLLTPSGGAQCHKEMYPAFLSSPTSPPRHATAVPRRQHFLVAPARRG